MRPRPEGRGESRSDNMPSYPSAAERRRRAAAPLSVAKGDVARIHVAHEHPEAFEVAKNPLDMGPSWAELLLLLRAPIGQHLLGEVGRSVEMGAGEIEHERPGHDGH